jgi:fatty-acyl-CoA synthase
MQNSPQFVIAYYGILRANAVVVPLNPMYLTQEFLRCAKDAGATTVIVSQELYPRIEPLLGGPILKHVIVAAYSDYLKKPTDLAVPEFISAPRLQLSKPGLTLWRDALASALVPGRLSAGPDDLCVMPYTSGTTGEPKGCMHTHRTTMHTLVAGDALVRRAAGADDAGRRAVLSCDRHAGQHERAALQRQHGRAPAALGPCRRGRVRAALPHCELDRGSDHDPGFLHESEYRALRSVLDPQLSGGGAAMPAAVAQRLLEPRHHLLRRLRALGNDGGHAHQSPGSREEQCLGIPIYGVDSRVVDPGDAARSCRPAKSARSSRTVRRCSWAIGTSRRTAPRRSSRSTASASAHRRSRAVDEDGYFFMVDRLKRMINASGFKVWPTEVES